jgi:hypothetical protein
VRELIELLSNSGGNSRVVVADIQHANARGEVEIFLPIGIPYSRAFGTYGEDRVSPMRCPAVRS